MSSVKKDAHMRLPPFVVDEDQGKRDVSRNFLVITPWVNEFGQFEKTYCCIRRTDGLPCAVHIADKCQFSSLQAQKSNSKSDQSEVLVMEKLNHPNLVEFYDFYESADDMMLVTELCIGGDLAEGLVERARRQGGYNEKMVALVLEQVLRAVEHLHSLDICHCDLKPSNILFIRKEEMVNVKVVGFGRANGEPKWKRYLNKQFGNLLFMAPEAVHGSYGKEMDLWSVGALMYAMFVGCAPFEEATDGQLFKREKSRTVMSRLGRREINRNVMSRMEQGFKGLPDGVSISSEARDLLHSLLTTNSAERYTVQQALEHS